MDCEFWERPIGEAGDALAIFQQLSKSVPESPWAKNSKTRLDRLVDESSSVEMSELHTSSVKVKMLRKQPWRGAAEENVLMMSFLSDMLMAESVENLHQSVRWQGGDKNKRDGSKTQSSSDELSSGGRRWIKRAWIVVYGGSSRLTAGG